MSHETTVAVPAKTASLRGVIHVLLVCLAVISTIEVGLSGLEVPARRALEIFAVAIVLWTMTAFEDVFVALAAAVAMAFLVTGSPKALFAALGDNLVWLLVAAFIFAEALRVSGLAQYLVGKVAARARSLRRLFFSLTTVMIAMAFVIPSTTGRAALMLPVFTSIVATIDHPRTRTAFALLFPTAILLGAFASLIGAGAHIVAVELVSQTTGQGISFAYWALLGLPLAVATSYLGAEVILRMFVTPAERGVPIAVGAPSGVPVAVLRQPVIWIAAFILAGWLTAPWHGINETLIAIIGALAVAAPGIGVVRFKDALKSVDWGLLVFLASTISLAQALAASNAAEQLLQGPFSRLRDANLPPLVVAAVIAFAGISLHLVVHSRTARVAILLPPVLLLASEAGLDPLAAMLVAVAATGFCQSLMVSAKPVIMFGRIEGAGYRQSDLLRLSAVLAPLHLALVLVFAGLVWPWLGVGLAR
jgi:sodium-dependent dicarboxylate transporter 2/3/5